MINLSVVVPIYNGEDHIQELYRSITEALQGRIGSYEIVLVDDGSRDRSAGLLDELARTDRAVKVIHFEKHCGETAAVSAGLKQAQGEMVALMDADLSGDPRDIYRLMPFIGKVDFVNGKRMNGNGTWLGKLPFQIGTGIRNWLIGEHIQDSVSPLKLMRREVAQKLQLYNGMHRYLPTLAIMNGFSVIEVSVTRRKRMRRRPGGIFAVRVVTGIIDMFVISMLKKRVVRYRIRSSPNPE